MAASADLPGLEFDNDLRGRTMRARCIRTAGCRHVFVPQNPNAENPRAIYECALKSKHWTMGPCPGEAFTVIS
jgi:hypothetical protein